MTIYNLSVNLVYDNVYTKIGLNKSTRSQDIKKMISDVNQCPSLCSKFAKNDKLPSEPYVLVTKTSFVSFGDEDV